MRPNLLLPAPAAIAAANSVANSLKNPDAADGKKKARSALDLSMWDATAEFEEEEDIFGASAVDPNSMDGKEGDALHKAAADLCKAQIPECAKDINMLQMMYIQKIKSDCTAYENVLKQKKTQSAQKLQAAERALRETALEQYQNANKYDLGQCTIKFKECMQTTAGCGSDFAKCATTSAMDATNTTKSTSKKSSNYFVQGAVSTIEISASTYDALMSKKPLCESVTKQCTKVASQVWDTFLKEVAPQLKSAEIIAEDNARQDCIGNISSCFQKACKDTIDPNDPDGSYDMCLSRPEAMLNVCKIPLNNCGINATSAKEAQKSIIWDFVTARLAAMRVDACTTEVKECLTADDVCGKDYLNCIGLDTYTIVNMCHRDKLTACYSKEYGDDDKAQQDYIYSVAQGLILNIDNEMMAQCQKAANEAMIKVCGDVSSCELYNDDIAVGMDSLVSQESQDGNITISGLISFGNLEIKRNPDNWNYYMDVDGYMNSISDAPEDIKQRIQFTLDGIRTEVNRKIGIIQSDPQVDMCINGRDLTQIRGGDANTREENRATARFPALLGNYTYIIANSILDQAKSNYDTKYATLMSDAMADSDTAKNLLYCQALVHKEDFATDVESFNTDSGIISITPYEIVVAQTNIDEITKLIAEQHDKTDVVLDKSRRMIAKKTTGVAYEPGTQVCRITTTIYPCTGFESIYNSDSSSFNVGASVTVFGSGGGGFNYGQSKSSTEYQGNFCNSFAEPIISEQLVNLASGSDAAFANTTRSNLTSYNNSTQYIDNSTTKSTSVGLDLGTGDISNVGNNNTTTKNKVDNSRTTNINSNNTTKNNNKSAKNGTK